MADTLLTALSMKNHQPSTLLSMDSCAASHTELDRELNRQIILSRPPDINLPLSTDPSLPLHSWNPDNCDLLDVHLGSQVYQTETLLHLPKVARKCAKRLDSIWGAWVFFNFYFKPVLNDKAKGKITRDSNGISGFDKLDLQLDVFLVQHDMENMYMWVFKERPENALGKMQLRSYMNGHSRQGERLFPFSVDKGFVRSHRMQRKHYRGLSNPQCVHGIEIIRSPNLTCLSDDEKKRWMDLTGRDLNFLVPLEASDFGSWRNLPNTDFELERHLTSKSNGNSRKLLGSGLNLSTLPLNHGNSDGMDVSPKNKKRKEFSPHGSDEDCYIPVNNPTPNRVSDMEIHHPIGSVWSSGFTGVMRNTSGPVTASKTIYEDEEGYLIVVSLPFADLQRVKVSWRNTLSCGIVKISCVSTARMPFIKRHERTFKLTDPSPEHCPPGEFIREIQLAGRIPEDAKLEAYYDETGTVLEIMVPKHRVGPEEHEVRVCLRPHLGTNDLLLT